MEVSKLQQSILQGKREREQAEIQIDVHALNQAIQTINNLYQASGDNVSDVSASLTKLYTFYQSLYRDAFFPAKKSPVQVEQSLTLPFEANVGTNGEQPNLI